MVEAQSHRDLMVWRKAMDLVIEIYRVAKRFPAREVYGLTQQLLRAAISVPANIAEGNARGSRRQYAYHIGVSRGSLMETETYLLLAIRLGYLTDAESDPVLCTISEVGKMLTTLHKRLR